MCQVSTATLAFFAGASTFAWAALVFARLPMMVGVVGEEGKQESAAFAMPMQVGALSKQINNDKLNR